MPFFQILYIVSCDGSGPGLRHTQHKKLPTCKVVKCLSLNLSCTYRSIRDVLPTQPSPNKTTLNWFLRDAEAIPTICDLVET